ncbi:MAG: hypothetical protein R6W77_16300 [Trueperaceae bacterium]
MSYTYLEYAHLPAGRRSRLANLTQRSGGRLAILELAATPLTGPDAFANGEVSHRVFRLAADASLSGVATSLGIAHTYFPDYAELLPLVLDLNGSYGAANGAPGDYALQATVEDALRLNAQAVRFTVDLDGEHARSELDDFRTFRAEAHHFNLPVVLRAPSATARRLDAAAAEQAMSLVHAALHLGADMVEIPAADIAAGREGRAGANDPARRVVAMLPVLARLEAAGDSQAAVGEARAALDLGCVGLVAGAPLYVDRTYPEALALVCSLHEQLAV